MAQLTEITLTRDSILGLGDVSYPRRFDKESKELVEDVTRSGRVTKLNCGVRGQIVKVDPKIADRLINLESAMRGAHKTLPPIS